MDKTRKCSICAREVTNESDRYASINVHYDSPISHNFSGFVCSICSKKFKDLVDWIHGESEGR